MKKNRINLPIAAFSLILVIVCELLFVIPILRGNNDITGNVLRLDSMITAPELNKNIKLYLKNHILSREGTDLGSGTVFQSTSDSLENEVFSCTYPINISFTRLNGKFAALKYTSKENAENLIHVEILGDEETMIYKSEWDIEKTPLLMVDEPLDKVRNITIALSCSETMDMESLEIAMLDFAVSKEDGLPPAVTNEIPRINTSLQGNWGGTYNSGTKFDMTIVIPSVQDGIISDAVVTFMESENHDRTGSFSAKGTVDYETRFVNLFPDHWIQEPEFENMGEGYIGKNVYLPIYAKLNEPCNIIEEDGMRLVVKKLPEGGQKK